jgi:hypothetical protein
MNRALRARETFALQDGPSEAALQIAECHQGLTIDRRRERREVGREPGAFGCPAWCFLRAGHHRIVEEFLIAMSPPVRVSLFAMILIAVRAPDAA